MYQYRQVLVRLRQGDTDRQIREVWRYWPVKRVSLLDEGER